MSLWQHKKGSVYEILGYAVEEATLNPVVIYRSLSGGGVWTRPCKNFFDGRFTQIVSPETEDMADK